jgi:anti-sigma B factor antagonist
MEFRLFVSRSGWLQLSFPLGTAMQLHEYRENGTDVLALAGEIDLHYAPAFRALLKAKAKTKCRRLLLDLSRVSFIDSTGLAVLIEYLRMSTAFDGRFCLGGIGKELGYIFETIRLDRAMPIFRDVARAKEALASDRLPSVSEPLFERAM